jgi:hypothetical protein
MTEHRYYWHEGVIVGYSLSALIYAFYTGMPVVGYMSSAPWHFERLLPALDLSEYGMGKGTEKYQTALWHRLYMLLSMGGQMPFADNAASIRIDDNSLVVSTNNRSRIVRGEYSNAWIFDDDNIEGLPPVLYACEEYRVADWFDVRSGMKHGENHLLDPSEDFVRSIYFYPSERINGNHQDRKDLCSVSFLHESTLDDFEYSPTYARFKILQQMTNMGIHGSRNGFSAAGEPKYYALKIEFSKREKRRIEMHTYEESTGIIFNRVEPNQMLKESLEHSRNIGSPSPANPYIPKVLLLS